MGGDFEVGFNLGFGLKYQNILLSVSLKCIKESFCKISIFLVKFRTLSNWRLVKESRVKKMSIFEDFWFKTESFRIEAPKARWSKIKVLVVRTNVEL